MQIGGFSNINNNSNHIEQNKKQTNSTLSKIAAAKETLNTNSSTKAIVESLNSQISSLSQGINNANDGIAILQIADGTVNDITQNSTKLAEIAIRSNSDILSGTQKQMIEDEASSIKESINRSIDEAKFNDKNIFGAKYSFLAGLNSVDISLENLDADSLDITDLGSIEQFQDTLTRLSSDIGSATNALASSISSTLEAITDLSNSKETLENGDMDQKISDMELDKTDLSSSLMVQMHSSEILQRSVSTLLD